MESDVDRNSSLPGAGRDLLEPTLMAIARGTASETGDAFFRSLVKHLALTLGVRYAFVARFTANKTRLRTLALWAGDDFAENMEYAMAGTPCEVVLEGEMRLYSQGVQALFPKDRALARIGAESYLAVPLIDNAGEVLGHLAVIDTRPMAGAPAELAIFQIFAARVVAEMDRLNAHRALQRRARMEELIAETSTRFINLDTEQIDQEIDRILTRIGAFVEADRCHLFLITDHGTMVSNTHEWVAPGVQPLREGFKSIPQAELAWAMDRLRRLEVVDVPSVEALPPEAAPLREKLRSVGIGAHLGVPMSYARRLVGFLGFDREQARGWSAQDVRLLRMVGEIVVSALERRRIEERLKEANRATEQANRLLEQRVEARTEALRRAHERLRRKEQLAAIGGFAAGIVHEIRSPLSTVNMALDHLKGLGLAESAARRVALAGGEAARLERLLAEILFYAKPPQLRRAMLDARALLEDTLAIVRGSPEAAHCRIVLECAGEVGVYGDRDKLQQVFINLLGNACEASPDGAAVTVEVTRMDDEQAVRMRVHNTGEPIPPQALPRLTEPFYSTKAKGTGLGLAIVQRVVEAHQGRLGIESSAQRGTQVSVLLPSLITQGE